jgi:hypothetical protein
MGTDIHGWVEIKTFRPAQWHEIMRLELLIGRNYRVFAFLFDVRNIDNHNKPIYTPIASLRGIPIDVSAIVKREATRNKDYQARAHSWITWAEIRRINWRALAKMKPGVVPGSDWQMLFKIMEALAERYGDEHVRLVVWFDS